MPLKQGYHILEESLDEESYPHEKTLDETFEEMKKISTMDTFWNACNSVQGLTILAMPLVTSFGGYWFLFGITAIAVLSNYTSKILIQCLYEQFPGKGRTRVRNTFADIGDAFWPKYGRLMVDATKFLELIFVATVNPIACGGHLLHRSLPSRWKAALDPHFRPGYDSQRFPELCEITFQDQHAYHIFCPDKLLHHSCLLLGS